MSAFFKNNATIKQVERYGNADRYGRKLSNMVAGASMKRVRLERRTSSSIGVDGRASRVDGVMMITGLSLLEQDTITMTDNSVWNVFSTDEATDIQGNVKFRTYKLVKKQ